MHLVKTPLGALRAASSLAMGAVRHPIRTAGDAVSLGRGIVGAVVTGYQHDTGQRPEPAGPVARPVPEEGTFKKQGDPVDQPTRSRDTTPPPPDITPPETSAPTVEHEEIVTEPSSVSGPGDEEEIPSSAVPFVEEDTEVTTPVGTTGAGPAVNPDTTESDLQQPGTEPLMDPSTTKRIKAETDILRRASDTAKE